MKNKICVIVPAFNAEKTIQKTLESLKNQSVKDFECIVVNDGSSDKTESIAKKFSFVKIINQKNFGISYARNIGAKNAQSELIAFLDADVVVEKQWIEKMLKAFEKDKNVFCVCGNYSGELNGSFSSDFFAFTIASSQFQGYNIAFRKKEFLETGGFDESFKYSEEPEFFFRTFEQNKKLKQINALSIHSSYGLIERLEKNFEYSQWDAKTLKKHFNLVIQSPVNFVQLSPANIKYITGFYFLATISLFLVFFNAWFAFFPAFIGVIKFVELKEKVQYKNNFLALLGFAFIALIIISWIKFAGFIIGLAKK
ncbi:MAG: glycosyltransferase family A protein [archaeon]|nr:glycosyltransferase family A protein [archaeon]